MRTLTLVLVLSLILLGGCVYTQPVTTNHTIAIDPAVLGLWQAVPDPGKDAAAASHPADLDVRNEAHEAWWLKHGACVRAARR